MPIGHWIIDGFPNTKDDWSAMAEGDLMPYDLIVVKDLTEKFEHIIEKERISIFFVKLSKYTHFLAVPNCDGGGLRNELFL